MAVRAVRGAVQVAADERELVLAGTTELVVALFEANSLTPDDVISMVFTATPDLTSEFPALAARELGLADTPLLCAAEIGKADALPRVVRILAHVETMRSKQEVRHVYLGGAAALRRDIAQ
ncbi:chorismate mutase [Actinospica durhamensis]|uniref:chorismate mutase n=1 Tax=Actinospica durhamensis TaxID=1508375 RepID=A0A941ITR8_9ACTN|nr:chorismate mutase [Actinospica durhamensis]MBR7837987.1 chorismate mutase [Actinospica durhamensis]